jgi:hypothetical protein
MWKAIASRIKASHSSRVSAATNDARKIRRIRQVARGVVAFQHNQITSAHGASSSVGSSERPCPDPAGPGSAPRSGRPTCSGTNPPTRRDTRFRFSRPAAGKHRRGPLTCHQHRSTTVNSGHVCLAWPQIDTPDGASSAASQTGAHR